MKSLGQTEVYLIETLTFCWLCFKSHVIGENHIAINQAQTNPNNRQGLHERGLLGPKPVSSVPSVAINQYPPKQKYHDYAYQSRYTTTRPIDYLHTKSLHHACNPLTFTQGCNS